MAVFTVWAPMLITHGDDAGSDMLPAGEIRCTSVTSPSKYRSIRGEITAPSRRTAATYVEIVDGFWNVTSTTGGPGASLWWLLAHMGVPDGTEPRHTHNENSWFVIGHASHLRRTSAVPDDGTLNALYSVASTPKVVPEPPNSTAPSPSMSRAVEMRTWRSASLPAATDHNWPASRPAFTAPASVSGSPLPSPRPSRVSPNDAFTIVTPFDASHCSAWMAWKSNVMHARYSCAPGAISLTISVTAVPCASALMSPPQKLLVAATLAFAVELESPANPTSTTPTFTLTPRLDGVACCHVSAPVSCTPSDVTTGFGRRGSPT